MPIKKFGDFGTQDNPVRYDGHSFNDCEERSLCPQHSGDGEGEEDDSSCPECAAPLGAPHDPGCPMDDSAEPDPDRFREGVQEGAGFDKFMDRIVLQERRTQKVDGKENNPARMIAGNYQERPLGRTRYGVKR